MLCVKSNNNDTSQKEIKVLVKTLPISHMCGVFANIAETVLAREEVMINTINSPVSNGAMEGTNNKIKLIKRRWFGYRNDAHLFLQSELETGH